MEVEHLVPDGVWYEQMLEKLDRRRADLTNQATLRTEQDFLRELRYDLKRRQKAAWKHKVEQDLERQLRRLEGRSEATCDLEFSAEHLALLVGERPELKQRLLHTIRHSSNSIKAVRFEFDNAVDLPVSLTTPSEVETMVFATSLGQLLGSIPTLETASIHLNESTGPEAAIFLTTVFLLGCRQVKTLDLYVEQAMPETMEPLLAFMQGNSCLEAVKLLNYSNIPITTLMRPLISLKKLASVSINGAFIRTTHEAELFQEVLQIDTLDRAELLYVTIESEAAMDVVCAGLATSKMRRLHGASLAFPVNKGSDLARALTSSKLEDLAFEHHEDTTADYYETLGQRLSEWRSTNLTVLRLDNLNMGSDDYTANLVVLLQHAHKWRVRDIYIDFSEIYWTPAFKAAFSAYLGNGEHLRRLIVGSYRSDYVGRQLASTPILEALGTGKGSLDEIKFVCGEDKEVDVDDDKWTRQLKRAVTSNVNRQRRLAFPLLERAAKAPSKPLRQLLLVKGFAVLDADTRFQFLSGDERQCRGLLLDEIAPEITYKKRKHSALSEQETVND